MAHKNELREIPRLLQQFIHDDLPLIENNVRQWRLGEGPIFVVGEAHSRAPAMMASYAFEVLLNRPVSARSAPILAEYTLRSIEPRSPLVAISRLGEDAEILHIARLATARGSAVWAVTAADQSSLAQMARAVIPVFHAEGCSSDAAWTIGAEVGAIALPMVAARVLRKLSPSEEKTFDEFVRLPRLIENTILGIQDAAGAFTQELRRFQTLFVSGGGFYHPIARHAATECRALGIRAQGVETTHFSASRPQETPSSSSVLFLSGSGCRLKKHVHAAARQARSAGMEIFAITDANDRDLVAQARSAMLLPQLQEPAGAVLALSVLQWMFALG